jgi:hypothetical protein
LQFKLYSQGSTRKIKLETTMLADDKLDAILEQATYHRSASEAPFAQWADAPIAAPAAPEAHSNAMLELRQLAEPDAPGDDAEAWHLPPPGIHTTGTQLRHRLVTPESIAELESHRKPSLVQRLLRRT